MTLLLLTGCPAPPHAPAPAGPAPGAPAAAPLQPTQPAPHLGTPYDVVAADSLLTILVYRAGTLASAGHNHVIASHQLGGTVYLPADPQQASFELHLPVAALTVDEPELRAQQSPREFPPDVSQGAREGTRRNMLGEALLDAAQYPEIVLRSIAVRPAVTARAAQGQAVVQVESSVRGAVRTFEVALTYQLSGTQLTVQGELPLRQTQLGLTPFSALLGALQVQDEMQLSFRLVARAASGAHSASSSSSSGVPSGL